MDFVPIDRFRFDFKKKIEISISKRFLSRVTSLRLATIYQSDWRLNGVSHKIPLMQVQNTHQSYWSITQTLSLWCLMSRHQKPASTYFINIINYFMIKNNPRPSHIWRPMHGVQRQYFLKFQQSPVYGVDGAIWWMLQISDRYCQKSRKTISTRVNYK